MLDAEQNLWERRSAVEEGTFGHGKGKRISVGQASSDMHHLADPIREFPDLSVIQY